MSLSGFRRVIVSFIGPYSFLLWRICNAYADCGLLLLCFVCAPGNVGVGCD